MIEEHDQEYGCVTSVGTQALLTLATVTNFMVQLFVTLALMLAPISSQLGVGVIDRGLVLLAAYLPVLLVGLPALVPILGSGSRRHRSVGITLVWGVALAAGLTVVRQALPLSAVNSTALARAAVGLLFCLPALLGGRAPGRWPSMALALLLGALLALPSLLWGALGSWLDTARALLDALMLGLVGAAALALLRPVLVTHRQSPAADVWLAGATLSATLAGVAGAWGQDDQNLLLLLALPVLAFPAAALARPAPPDQRLGLGPAGLLLALAAWPLLALFDPRETIALMLISGETATLAFLAALTSAALGLVFGTLTTLIGARPRVAGSIVSWALALLMLLGAGAAYGTAGQPGTHGDQLFVIMREQADLSGAAAIEDVAERRAFVYRTLTEHANRSQADLRAWLDAQGIGYQPYYLLNGIEVFADAPTRQQLAGRADVDRVLLSPELRPLPELPQPEPGASLSPDGPGWNITMIRAERAWEEFGARGQGIVVGQSDSGVDWQHPALRARYRGASGEHSYSWLDPWYGRPEPYDISGHGTHTLGSVLGDGGIGVAPDATWFACANLIRNLASPAYYLDCMQFLLAPYPQGGDPLSAGRPELAADVSNNSWGCPPEEGCDARALEQAAASLRAAGIFVVASAGNDGPTCESLSSPIAIYDSVLTVGAVDREGNLAQFSSRGPQSALPEQRRGPDIIAPGVEVLSAWPGGGYTFQDGTSMAGPHVAGVVALMWSANPALRGDVETTARILRETAQPYAGVPPACAGGSTPDPATGYGLVDAYAAVQAAIDN